MTEHMSNADLLATALTGEVTVVETKARKRPVRSGKPALQWVPINGKNHNGGIYVDGTDEDGTTWRLTCKPNSKGQWSATVRINGETTRLDVDNAKHQRGAAYNAAKDFYHYPEKFTAVTEAATA